MAAPKPPTFKQKVDAVLLTLTAKDEATPVLRTALQGFANLANQARENAETIEIYRRAEANLLGTLNARDAATRHSAQELENMDAALHKVQLAIINLVELQGTFGVGMKQVSEAIAQATAELRSEEASIKTVSQLVEEQSNAYDRLIERKSRLQAAQGVIQGQMDARAGFPYFGRGEESRQLTNAMNLIRAAIAETDAALEDLSPSISRINAAFATSVQQAKEEEQAIRSITEVVREASRAYDSLTNRRDLLTRTQGILQEQIQAREAFPQFTGGNTEGLRNALNLVNAELEETEEQLQTLPKGMAELANAEKMAADQAKAQAAAQNSANAATQTAAERNRKVSSEYENLIRQLAQARRVVRELEHNMGANPAVAGALQQAKQAVTELETAIASLTPEQRVLAQATSQVVAAMREETRAIKGSTAAHDEHGRAQSKVRKHAEDVARGLSSSLFSFSLIAGGLVAVGHLIGNTLTGAVEASDKLYASIADLSTLNPRLDADELFGQITELSERLGVVSNQITDIYKIAAPTARGDPDASLALTEELIMGARAGRQNPAAWAEAASSTLRAYQLDLSDTTRVQDILTYAMQNSAGQGSKLLDVWGSVSKAAAGANTPLEENAGAMILLARHGGDLEENMRALKGAFDAMSTEDARSELESLGIATTDYRGNVLGLMDIVSQLGQRLEGLPTGERDSIISRLFNDRDVRNVMRTLISSWQEYRQTVEETYSVSGTMAAAHIEYLDSASARTEKLAAFQQTLSENIGNVIQKLKELGLEWLRQLDMGQQAADYIPGYANFNDAQKQAVQQFFLDQRDEAVRNQRLLGLGAENIDITPEEFEELRDTLRHLGNEYHDANLAAAQFAQTQEGVKSAFAGTPIGPLVHELTSMVEEAARASDQWLTMKNFQDDLKTSASSLIPALSGVGSSVRDIYDQSVLLEQRGAFGGFGSAEQQALANASQELDRVNRVLDRMLNMKPSETGFWGMLANKAWEQAINTLIGRVNSLQGEAEAAANAIRIQSPEYKEDVRQYEEFVESQQGAERLEAAQDNLNATTAKYAKEVEGLQEQQEALQRAMRDNSAPDLARAYADLQQKTSALEAGTKRFDDALHDLRNELRDLEQQSKTSLDPLEEALEAAERDFENWESGADEVTQILEDQLYDLEQQAASTRRETEYMLTPLRDEAKRTSEELETLQEELRDLQEGFDDAESVIRDDIERLQELRDTNLQPLEDEIDALNDALQDMRDQEEAALRPLEDLAYGQQQALEAIRDEIEAISEEYANQLIPLQEEYNALQQEQSRVEREREARNRRLSIENLTAQLATATPGSAAALQMSRQLAELRNEDARLNRMGELQDQIQAIEEERDARLKSAREREEQAQKELDDTNRQIEQIRRRYELERRQLEDTLQLRERAFRDQKEQYDDAIEMRQRDLREMEKQHKQTLKNKEADVELAQTRADNARQTLEDLEETRTAIQKVDDAAVEAKRNELEATQRTQDDQRRIRSESVKEAKDAYDEEKEYWDDLIEAVNLKIERTQFDGSEFERVAKQEVKDAQTYFDQLRTEYQNNINKINDQIKATQKTATDAVEAAKVVVEQEREKQKALSLTYAWINAINQAMKSGVPIDVGQLPPDVRAWYERMYGSQPTGDADQGVGLSPPYNPTPPPQPTGDADQGVGTGSRPSAQVPDMPVTTRAATDVGGRGLVVGTMNVNLDIAAMGGLKGDPMDPRTWEQMAKPIVEGLQTGMSRHGVRIEVS